MRAYSRDKKMYGFGHADLGGAINREQSKSSAAVIYKV
jgi:hypothetical protein